MPDGLRLLLARAAAWALFVCAWLQLGQAGQAQLPLWAGGLLPLALWMALWPAGMSLFLPGLAPAALRAALLAAAGLAACGLALQTAPGVLLAAAAWAVLVVAASHTVRRLRPAGRAASPLLPATLGVAAAGGLSHAPGWLGVLMGGLLLALLVPPFVPAGARPGGCRRGLFDGLWPGEAGPVVLWPLAAARWTMLPMMAMLPLLGQWCSAAGIAPAAMLALHLAAMLAPAWLLRHARPTAGFHPRACAALLLLGAVAAWAWPGLMGLMAASLLHTLAWGLAWVADTAARPLAPLPAAQGAAVALLPALLLLVLGTALALFGPSALLLLHALLALPAALALRSLRRGPQALGSR